MDTDTVKVVLDNQTERANQFVEYFQEKWPKLLDFGLQLIIAAIVFFIGTKVIKMILKLIRKSFVHAGLEEGSINFLNSLAKAILYVILVSAIAVSLGVKEASVAALLGSMGLGIVLALKESLSNLAGGFILLIMRPFSTGDYIKEDGHGNEGTVMAIDLFYTTLVTSDNRTIVLPNGILANTSLTNLSQQDKRQLRETVGISYGANIKKAKEILEYILNEDESILKTEPIEVFVENLGESSVDIGWRGWVSAGEYWTTRCRVLEIIKYEFDKQGIEIPYRQMDISVRQIKEE